MIIFQDRLASDYVQGGRNFLWAAEQINKIAPSRSKEGMFIAENPIYFLLGHSTELLLKSVLAKNGVSHDDLQYKYKHDLKKLLSKFKEFQVPVDVKVVQAIDVIAEHFNNHDYRYARTFGGFLDDETFTKFKRGEMSEKEKKKFGLNVRSGLNIDHFIEGLNNQLSIVVDHVNGPAEQSSFAMVEEK